MSESFQLICQAGIGRDGTALDTPYYVDGEWVRFDRGRPRKIGGYRAMTTKADGPVRSLLVDSRNGVNSLHTFSPWGVRRLEFNADGSGGSLEDRTPAGFAVDTRLTWSQAVMASSTGGSYAALLAASAPDVDMIDSDEAGFLYAGDIKSSDPLTVVSDANGPIRVSGGVTVLGPICVVYGSNGNIRNSNPNDFSPSGWNVGGSSLANNANPVGSKILYGCPVRGGGNSPAGLFWAVDALIRMSLSGNAQTLWNYDTLTQPTSILSKKCVVEHDGKFFWIGTDRFLMYNGVVQEVPNPVNNNWFFDNINMDARNKVWGTKIPRWGEIWWFFPMGEATECNAAIIYNYRENTWYDAVKMRSAGGNVQIFPFPIWAGSEDTTNTLRVEVGNRYTVTVQAAAGANTLTMSSTTNVVNGDAIAGPGIAPGTTVTVAGLVLTLSQPTTAIVPVGTAMNLSHMTTPFKVGEVVTGGTSGATGTVERVQDTVLNLVGVTGAFAAGVETLTGSLGGAGAKNPTIPVAQELMTVYQHEYGLDKVVGDAPAAIRSSVTSKDFGFAIGTPFTDSPKSAEIATRVIRVEPDYIQAGDLRFELLGRDFADEEAAQLASETFVPQQAFVDVRDAQARILRLRLVSNTLGGNYIHGKVKLTLDAGDERSQVPT